MSDIPFISSNLHLDKELMKVQTTTEYLPYCVMSLLIMMSFILKTLQSPGVEDWLSWYMITRPSDLLSNSEQGEVDLVMSMMTGNVDCIDS